ncbi:hypothetical protein ONZ45_g9157 [Pleurotus djamor]|nr:hypothetical protein ONZ45_g9157 [Pleurotus djamor]
MDEALVWEEVAPQVQHALDAICGALLAHTPIICGHQVIMTTWTWSVWSCNRSIGITLSLLFAGTLTGLAILLHQFLSSIITIHPPNELPNGCYVSAGNNHLAIIIVLIMLYNGVTFAFMLAKCSTVLKFRRGHRAIFKRSLVNIVFINGTFYYAILFSLSIANVVVMKTLPPVMGDLLTA